MKPLSFLLLAALLAARPALAQAEPPPAGKPAHLKFDPARVVTVSGTVLAEQRVDHGKGTKSVRIVVKVGDEQASVHLGPDAWVDRQKIKLVQGDEVTVRGSRSTYEGRPVILAESVTRGTDVLVLRDGSGKPAWAGQLAKH